jgi:hypothetical protein
MADATYPFDSTGNASSNLITGEEHTTTPLNYRDFYYIIPTCSPFFTNNLSVTLTSVIPNRVLIENVDYTLGLPYLAATKSIGLSIYGAIILHNADATSTLSINYQTLGGEWIANPQVVRERLAVLAYNPKIVTWDIVTDQPNQFPPINHYQNFDTLYSEEDLINAIGSIAAAIENNPNVQLPQSILHLANFQNPHQTTKDQVGLGDVENLPMASDIEVLALSPVDKYITLKQLVSVLQALNLLTP